VSATPWIYLGIPLKMKILQATWHAPNQDPHGASLTAQFEHQQMFKFIVSRKSQMLISINIYVI